MDKSYIKSEEDSTKLGLWILFFNFLIVFLWLVYELFELFDSEPTYRWELSFNIIGLPMGLIFVFLLLFFITRGLVKTTLKK